MAVKAIQKKRDSAGRGGRPPKFDEPRRVVTVTLPERTLRELGAVEPDLARAIVKVTESAVTRGPTRRPLVELVKVGRGVSIILVAPSRSLQKIPWLRLIEVTPARFLLTIAPGTSVDSLEIEILDLLEGLSKDDHHERAILTALRERMRSLRQGRSIWKAEILFIGDPARPSSA